MNAITAAVSALSGFEPGQTNTHPYRCSHRTGSGGFGVISWPSAPGYFYAGGLDVNLTPSGFGMGRLRDGWMHAGKFVGGICGGICVETETLADGDHATLTHPDSTPDWTSDEILRHIQKLSDMARDAAAMGRMAAEAAQLALFFASCPLQQM